MRSDLPAPRIKRVSDRNNYGDTSTAGDLLHPSVHALQGVYEEHFFCPRSKEEVQPIDGTGVALSVFQISPSFIICMKKNIIVIIICRQKQFYIFFLTQEKSYYSIVFLKLR